MRAKQLNIYIVSASHAIPNYSQALNQNKVNESVIYITPLSNLAITTINNNIINLE